MTKVCYIIGTLEIGGAEKQLLKLCRGLDKTRFVPTVVCLRGGPLKRDFEAAGIPVIEAGKRHKIDLPFLWRLAGLVRRLRPDIVHTWMFTSNTWGRLAAVFAGVPVIFASERCVDPWKRQYHVAVDRFLLRFTRLVIGNSGAVKDFYQRLEGIPDGKIAVVHNGLDLPVIDRKAAMALRARLVPSGARYIVSCAGRFTDQKGFIHLLRAAPAVLAAVPDGCFVMVGDGPLMDVFRSEVRKLGIERNVVFTGYRNDVPVIFSFSEVVAVPSLFEGMPNVILEAMSVRRPVAGSAIPEIAELIADGETGVLTPVADSGALAGALIRLLKDEELCSNMGQKAYDFVREKFSVSTMVRKYESIYDGFPLTIRGNDRPKCAQSAE